jgi:hypothetical protein
MGDSLNPSVLAPGTTEENYLRSSVPEGLAIPTPSAMETVNRLTGRGLQALESTRCGGLRIFPNAEAEDDAVLHHLRLSPPQRCCQLPYT